MAAEQEGKPRPGKVPPPKCQALLLCEKTIVEQGTGRVSLINVLDSFGLSGFPGLMPEFSAVLELSEGIGRYGLVVEIGDLQEDIVLVRSLQTTVDWEDRLERFKLIVPYKSLEISHPGVYDLVVFANNEEVARLTFRVEQG